MHQPTVSLDLPRSKIRSLGFTYVSDIDSSNLCQEEWEECTKQPTRQTALELAEKERSESKVSTTIDELDTTLYGGLPNGQIVEFCGEPGSGKTQLCFQIAVNKLLSDLEKSDEVLYISTNSNFATQRLKEIIKSSAQYKSCPAAKQESTINNILERFHVLECCEIADLIGLARFLPWWICNHHKLSLLIVDSIFVPIKPVEFNDRKKVIYRLFASLQTLASKYRFPIILTNNTTTRVQSSEQVYKPACLGENYYHRINLRIMLTKHLYGVHRATVVKSALCKNFTATFKICN